MWLGQHVFPNWMLNFLYREAALLRSHSWINSSGSGGVSFTLDRHGHYHENRTSHEAYSWYGTD
jgi:hypothetical protein